MYAAAPKRPFIPGLEYAGVISEVGSGVSGLKKGDRVMGVTRFGAYASALNVDARYVRALPDNWSFEDGAAHLVAALTAYYGLIDQCRLQKGEMVLIQSAAGAVGLAALRIAKKHGAYCLGVVGSDAKKDLCLAQGYDAVITRSHFGRQLREALGDKRLDVVMESIGGETLRESFRLLAPRGRVSIYGFAQYMPQGALSYIVNVWRYLTRPRFDTFRFENRAVSGFNLIYLFDHAELIRSYAEEIEKLDIGKPYISVRYSFKELPSALEALKAGNTIGKVVVTL
jgi:alcohol dehydrogenase